MPTVLRIGSYRFFFYSNENEEPAHIHVRRDDCEAKFWLDPVALAANRGFARNELSKVRVMVEQHRELLLKAWNDYFGD
jgi:hypothetical protein